MQNNKDMISVIIPVYKAENFLDQCVESIVRQTYDNLDIILVDDGSPDKCPQICDEWAKQDHRIRVIHKKNGGASSARNVALRVVKGKYVTFVDSDDWLELDALKKMYDLINEHTADMVIGRLCIRKKRKSSQKMGHNKTEIWNQRIGLEKFFEKKCHTACGRLIRSDLLDKFSFIEGKMNEDIHFAYCLARKSRKTIYTNTLVYNWFKNKNGITNSPFTMKKMDLLYIWDIVIKLVDKFDPEYHYACEMNCKRARFTLLSKILIDGYDRNDTNLCILKDMLKKEVRGYYWSLMAWKMPISRKILLTVVCLI